MSIYQHCHWRTVEEWGKLNVPLSTPNNEASKMFDATLTQICANYEDPNLGGVSTTLQKMLSADPDFVMGQCLALDLQLYGAKDTVGSSEQLKKSLENLKKLSQKQTQLTDYEKMHVKATQLLSEGYMKEACVVWEDILVNHPLDLVALRMTNTGYIFLGDSPQLRDGIARVLPHWSRSTPLYGYIVGMHAFGLEETSLYDQAVKTAEKALEINRHDAWSTHALSHVFEMTGQQKRGIDFLDSTVDDWDPCDMMACHNWWHLALHHIEQANYEEALTIFENQVKKLAQKRGEMFNIIDAASLLLRLDIQGVKLDQQWKDIREVCTPYLNKHAGVFSDLHLLMACLGAGDQTAVTEMFESLEQFVREGKGQAKEVHQKLGLAVCHALESYNKGDYHEVVDTLYPLRYQIFTTGGSNAQRDVFNHLLIVSAIQSSNKHHQCLARTLLAERKALKEHSPLTDRWIARMTSPTTA